MGKSGNLLSTIYHTPIGGVSVWLINKTGAPSVKGYIVEASSSVDFAVQYVGNNDIDPFGIVYDAGVADGELMRVVFTGLADVFYGTSVTRATFSRVPVAADVITPGQAVNEALPTPPFSTDKHFQEIGHPVESRGTPGLARTMLHWN